MRSNREEGLLYRNLEAGYRSLERGYQRILAWGLRHRPSVLMLAAAASGAGILIASAVPVDFMIPEDRSEFNVWLKMPLGSTLDQTQATSQRVEDEILDLPEVTAVASGVLRSKRLSQFLRRSYRLTHIGIAGGRRNRRDICMGNGSRPCDSYRASKSNPGAALRITRFA